MFNSACVTRICASTHVIYIRIFRFSGFILIFVIYPSLHQLAAGDDYTSVSVEGLMFNQGDTRVCHTVSIIDDGSCE